MSKQFPITKSKPFLSCKKLLDIGYWKLEIGNSSRGFTLVELLISIAIIGVVFGVIIGSTSQIQKTSRDTKREADLRNIQSALQQYFADRNYFPNNITIDSISTLTINSDSSVPTISPIKTYLKTIPRDPNPSSKYCYIAFKSALSTGTSTDCNNADASSGNRCYYYKLFTTMENSDSSALPDSYCGVSTYNFELGPN
jgi:prepilin-type N-terminal cleavage/methylation domain-containing protein